MLIRRLVSSDAAAYRELRLQGLQCAPTAFSSSPEEECATPLADIEALLAPNSGRYTFGALIDETLVGIVGVGRETQRKAAHKAFVRSLYVDPGHRGRRIAEHLLNRALDFAASLDGVRQVTLTVTEGNLVALTLYEKLGFKVYGIEPDSLLIEGAFYRDIHMVRLSRPA